MRISIDAMPQQQTLICASVSRLLGSFVRMPNKRSSNCCSSDSKLLHDVRTSTRLANFDIVRQHNSGNKDITSNTSAAKDSELLFLDHRKQLVRVVFLPMQQRQQSKLTNSSTNLRNERDLAGHHREERDAKRPNIRQVPIVLLACASERMRTANSVVWNCSLPLQLSGAKKWNVPAESAILSDPSPSNLLRGEALSAWQSINR